MWLVSTVFQHEGGYETAVFPVIEGDVDFDHQKDSEYSISLNHADIEAMHERMVQRWSDR
jgi:hypothetical protein